MSFNSFVAFALRGREGFINFDSYTFFKLSFFFRRKTYFAEILHSYHNVKVLKKRFMKFSGLLFVCYRFFNKPSKIEDEDDFGSLKRLKKNKNPGFISA